MSRIHFRSFLDEVEVDYRGNRNEAKKLPIRSLPKGLRGKGFARFIERVRENADDSSKAENRSTPWEGEDTNLEKTLYDGEGAAYKAAAIHFYLLSHQDHRGDARNISAYLRLESRFENYAQDPFGFDETLKQGHRPGLSRPTAPFHWPLYVSEADARSKDADPGVWLNPLNHHSIPLAGRQEERGTLDAFMGDARPFLICALIAPSGAGKTRLVSQWMRKFLPSTDELEWDAGFVTDRDPLPWKSWDISRNTLIVIDYTFAYDEVMRAIAERCRYHAATAGKKVRLLVIDHVYPAVLQNDFFWSQPFPDQRAVDGLKSSILFDRSPIELSPERRGSAILREVIAAAASSEALRYSEDHPEVLRAEAALSRMAGNNDTANTQAVLHPLFAALMGQAIREGRVDYEIWTRRDLIKHYFDKPLRLPWRTSGNDAAERGIWVGAYVSAATLLRGAAFADLRQHLPQTPGKLFAAEAAFVEQAANRLVSSSDRLSLVPFEPDILGENFLLSYLAAIEGDDRVSAAFINMLEGCGPRGEEESPTLNFLETAQRLTKNLLNDDPKLASVSEAWETLDRFLAPDRFPQGGKFRLFVSLTRMSIAVQCQAASQLQVADRFAERVDRNDLIEAATGPNYRPTLFRSLAFFDWLISVGKAQSADLEAVLALAFNYRNNPAVAGTSPLLPAAAAGYQSVVKLLLSVPGESVDRPDPKAGWTPLLAAARNGHVRTAELLLSQGADPNVGRIAGGWNALSLAALARSTAIVEALLKAGASTELARTDYGTTPLMIAFQQTDAATTRALILDGTDPWVHYHDWSSFMTMSRG